MSILHFNSDPKAMFKHKLVCHSHRSVARSTRDLANLTLRLCLCPWSFREQGMHVLRVLLNQDPTSQKINVSAIKHTLCLILALRLYALSPAPFPAKLHLWWESFILNCFNAVFKYVILATKQFAWYFSERFKIPFTFLIYISLT